MIWRAVGTPAELRWYVTLCTTKGTNGCFSSSWMFSSASPSLRSWYAGFRCSITSIAISPSLFLLLDARRRILLLLLVEPLQVLGRQPLLIRDRHELRRPFHIRP